VIYGDNPRYLVAHNYVFDLGINYVQLFRDVTRYIASSRDAGQYSSCKGGLSSDLTYSQTHRIHMHRRTRKLTRMRSFSRMRKNSGYGNLSIFRFDKNAPINRMVFKLYEFLNFRPQNVLRSGSTEGQCFL